MYDYKDVEGQKKNSFVNLKFVKLVTVHLGMPG